MFLKRLKNRFFLTLFVLLLFNFLSSIVSIIAILYHRFDFLFVTFPVFLLTSFILYLEFRRFKIFLDWVFSFDYEKPIPQVILLKDDELKKFLVEFKDKLIEESKIRKEKSMLEEYRMSFLSRISHELMAPVSIMKGYITLLSKKENDIKKLDYIEKVIRNITRLETLINQYIVTTREGFYPKSYEFKLFDFTELIFEIYEEYLPIAQERDINYIMKLPPYPNTVIGDPDAIKSAISNLVNNALKFTPPGGKIILEAVKEDGKIKFMIKDTGPGIKKEEIDLIFRPYFQGRTSRTKSGGMGLGLTIAKEIIEAHGSELMVDSEPGKGSCFYFYLPLKE